MNKNITRTVRRYEYDCKVVRKIEDSEDFGIVNENYFIYGSPKENIDVNKVVDEISVKSGGHVLEFTLKNTIDLKYSIPLERFVQACKEYEMNQQPFAEKQKRSKQQ